MSVAEALRTVVEGADVEPALLEAAFGEIVAGERAVDWVA